MAPDRGLDYRFVLVGDGSERGRLEALAHELPNIEFRDPVSEVEFPALLRSANVLLLCQAASNIDMSFPSKLTAYLASGRPVVAAVPPGGSVDAFLRRTNVGLVVEANDGDLLIKTIDTLLGDDGLQASLVQAGEEFVAAEWDRDTVLARWADAICPDR